MKNHRIALFAISALLANSIFAEEVIEEIIVTSSYIDQTLSEIENPLHVLSGEDISSTSTQSLGESLNNLLGVSSTDYGSGVGQPVIRGMSGNRVKILNNGMVVRDISGAGADHINDIDLNNIQQIEVVRGPSSLLYSNGSIGGIINVVDNTITRKDFIESELRIGLESQSVNAGKAHNLSYQNNIGGLNLSFAYKDSQFGNFDIPHGAILHSEEGHEEHEDEHHEEEEDHEEDLGYLPNSDYESTSKRFGLSKTGDWGYFGISVNNIESLYGIPFHGENHEDHEGEEHEGEEHEGEEHEGERIFSTTKSNVFNLEGAYEFNNSFLQKIDYFYRNSDYSLTEQHAEEEEHHEEDSTLFKNDAREYGAIFYLADSFLFQKLNFLSQKLVLNFIEEDISIIGAETFMRPTSNEEKSIGYYLGKELGSFHLDFGIRHDQISRNGSLAHKEHEDEDHEVEDHDGCMCEEEIEYFGRDIKNTSLALTLGRDINDFLDINLGLARVERAPSAVELFMNGPHLSTSRFEVGNTNLKSEASNNIDLTFNYENDGFFGVLTFFKNDVDNYIYLLDETEEEHGDHEGLILANYLQSDSQFYGYEFEFGKVFEIERGNLSLSFARDSISGEFKNGSNIPRMVPSRNIYSISYSAHDLELNINLKDVKEQKDIGAGETKTDGYQMLDVLLKQTFNFNNQSDLSLSIFANNLLDRVARNHTSFVKDKVPLPGRNYGIRFNFKY